MSNKARALHLRKDGLPSGLEYSRVMLELEWTPKKVLALGLVYEPSQWNA